MSQSQSQAYTIFCVLSNHLKTRFSVEVESSITVDRFKEEIVEKRPDVLKHIVPATLTLYRVDIPEDRNFEEKVGIKMEELPDPLLVSSSLSDQDLYPTAPPKKTIHILVVPPSSVDSPQNHPSAFPILNLSPDLGKTEDIDTVRTKIERFLTELRPKIKQFLNSPQEAYWSPPKNTSEEIQRFYEVLAIPLVNNEPSLLFHKLRDTPNPNRDILFKGNNTILCNTSGSGKTRLLLEGLCHEWGFYFVAAQGPDRIGSQDLGAMIEHMASSRGWIPDIFTNPSQVSTANWNNEVIAFDRISRVLIARWQIFHTFIEVAKSCYGEKLPDTIKHAWLLFQALPPLFENNMDPFLAFIDKCLSDADRTVLTKLDSDTSRTAPGSDHKQFFYVLDEIQVLGGQHTKSFSDASGEHPRPNIITSGVGKDKPWIVQHTTGDFILQEVACSNGSGDEELLKGNWNQHGPSSPQKMLNAYVKALSNFDPFDATGTVLDTEPPVSPLMGIASFEWENIDT
ncbi:10128_t:CDS:2, partial [Acaulospora colombiana]